MSRINEIDHARVSLMEGFNEVEIPESKRRLVSFEFRIQRQGFSAALLAGFLLKLPVDAKIMRVVELDYNMSTGFLVESSEFPEMDDGPYLKEPPRGTVILHSKEFGNRIMNTSVEAVEWPT